MLSESERQAIRQKLTAAMSSGRLQEVIVLARELMQSGKSADTLYCASVLSNLAGSLVAQHGYKRLKTYVVRSVTVEPILPFLKVEGGIGWLCVRYPS